MIRARVTALLLSGLGAGFTTSTAPAMAAVAGGLLPHRAVYDLELKEASDRSGIAGMYGRMVYEFNGSACNGYTTNFRFVTQIDTGEDTRVTDQQTTTFEDLKAKIFRFSTKSFTDEQLDKEVSGAAMEEPDKLKVELLQPEKRALELATGQFPTQHMIEIIENAKKGRALFESRIFDGSDDADAALLATTVVGKPELPVSGDPDAGVDTSFAKTSFWPVSIAYFNDTPDTDAQPVYRMSFKLYENGVTRDLTMDYGDFVLTGKLKTLEFLKPQDCK